MIVRKIATAALAALGTLAAGSAQASISCIDATYQPVAGQPRQPLPSGFEACREGALVSGPATRIWRCAVQPGFEDKVNATHLVVIERDGKIVKTDQDDLIAGPLYAITWYEVDFDRDGFSEHVIARRTFQSPAHAIQFWRVSIMSADWQHTIVSFDNLEDFGPDALFRDSDAAHCKMLDTTYATEGSEERLRLEAEVWTVSSNKPSALDVAPPARLLDAAFQQERRRWFSDGRLLGSPYRWLYGHDHDAVAEANAGAGKLLGAVRGYVLLGEACRGPLGNDLADAAYSNSFAALERLAGESASARAFVDRARAAAEHYCAQAGPCWKKYFRTPDASEKQGFAVCANAFAQAQEDFSTLMVVAMTSRSGGER